MPRDAVSRTANVGMVGKNGLCAIYAFLHRSVARAKWHALAVFNQRETISAEQAVGTGRCLI